MNKEDEYKLLVAANILVGCKMTVPQVMKFLEDIYALGKKSGLHETMKEIKLNEMKTEKTIICPTCGKEFKSLGYARHRSKHYDDRQKEKTKQLHSTLSLGQISDKENSDLYYSQCVSLKS